MPFQVPDAYRLRPSQHRLQLTESRGERASTAGEWSIGPNGTLLLALFARPRYWYVFPELRSGGWEWINRHQLPIRARTRKEIYRAVLAAAALDTPPGYPPLIREPA